ncbi:MAG TPA: fumarylacetoacetate hydrolase family protein [Azospirillaceae bacterium]|nr:fumarylacetoacetate hydrolase family protein [Azospirillaceae bacterium]
MRHLLPIVSLRRLTPALALPVVLAGGAAHAACPSAAAMDAFARDWTAKTPARAVVAGGSLEDAYCAQGMLVERITPGLGRVVGYKAGLTSKPLQDRFKVSGPVLGQLLSGMLVEDGATIPAAFGARPLYEADLLLVVGDEGINQAASPEEAVRHIAAVRPFIELPDLMYAEGEPMDGVALTAANVGARLGVVGAELPLETIPNPVQTLAGMTVAVSDADGATLAEGKGSAVLGNPLAVAVWVARTLAESGRRLRPGDLISVGSFTPLTPPKPGQTVTARYVGLPGDPKVTVTFR